MDYNELIDDVKGSCYSLHAYKEDCEALQQQWMSLFATQRPIFWTEITPQIWQFVCTLRVLIVRNGMV